MGPAWGPTQALRSALNSPATAATQPLSSLCLGYEAGRSMRAGQRASSSSRPMATNGAIAATTRSCLRRATDGALVLPSHDEHGD